MVDLSASCALSAARYWFGIMYLRTSPMPSLRGARTAGAGFAAGGCEAAARCAGSAASAAALSSRATPIPIHALMGISRALSIDTQHPPEVPSGASANATRPDPVYQEGPRKDQ